MGRMTSVGKVHRYVSLCVEDGPRVRERLGPGRVYCIDDFLWEASSTQQKGQSSLSQSELGSLTLPLLPTGREQWQASSQFPLDGSKPGSPLKQEPGHALGRKADCLGFQQRLVCTIQGESSLGKKHCKVKSGP